MIEESIKIAINLLADGRVQKARYLLEESIGYRPTHENDEKYQAWRERYEQEDNIA